MAEMNVQVCPGCGGRNGAGTVACEWCARPFAERRRPLKLRWWQLVAALLLGSAVAAVLGLAVLNANGVRFDPLPRPKSPEVAVGTGGTPIDRGTAPPTAPLPGGPLAAGLATPAVPAGAASPEPSATATRSPSPPPAPPTSTPVPPPPTSTPEPARYVRVTGTGNLGANLRTEPGGSQAVTAVAENTVLRLVGPEETAQGRLWRLCELESRGLQGWIAADLLQPTDGPGRP